MKFVLYLTVEMQLTQLKVRIHDALLHYKIRDDFNSNSWKEDNNSKQFIEFLQQIKDHYLQKSNCKNNISSDCILLILWELLEYTTIHNIVADEIVSLSIELLSLSSYNGRTICKIFDTMRMGLSTQSLRELLTVTIGNSTETITDNNTISNNEREPQGIPLKYHNQILSALTKFVTEDNPKHITFPGDKESFLQLSYVRLDLVNSYSLAMWIKLDPAMKPDQPFILYRCRCPNAGIDFVVTEYKDGMLSIVIRTQSETKSGTLRDEVWCSVQSCFVDQFPLLVLTISSSLSKLRF